MTNPKKHPHAEFIKEYLDDTSRVIESRYVKIGCIFHETSIEIALKSDERREFRFADAAKKERLDGFHRH